MSSGIKYITNLNTIMNPFLSLLVGPYGQAFALMDAYQFLPSQENFKEFTEEMYNAY